MQGLRRKELITVLLVVMAVVLGMYAYVMSTSGMAENITISSGSDSIYYDPDKEAAEITSILALGYQVDVEVNSNHVALHNSGSAALKCLSDKGNVASFSEAGSRRLHILCWDSSTKTLFDVIINRINYYVDKWANPKSQLITAYAPEGVEGASMLEKSTYYINHLKNTVGGKVVNLKFGPGEIMFIPK